MKIQMISPSKLKILFNLQDLKENNITLHSFLSGSENASIFLKAILEIAKEDLGFQAFGSNISYESFCFNYSEFVVIVSKQEYIRKYIFPQKLYFYFFNMDQFFDFSSFIRSNISFKFESSLYKLKSILFLEINSSNLIYEDFKRLCLILSEAENNLIYNKSNFSKIVITRFKEFGDILIHKNALDL